MKVREKIQEMKMQMIIRINELCSFFVVILIFFIVFFFFFQAEDGIRDLYVTGVQTCALPICTRPPRAAASGAASAAKRPENSHSAGAQSACRRRMGPPRLLPLDFRHAGTMIQDRKSTRLNSSHVEISYAVFCLKKKKKK